MTTHLAETRCPYCLLVELLAASYVSASLQVFLTISSAGRVTSSARFSYRLRHVVPSLFLLIELVGHFVNLVRSRKTENSGNYISAVEFSISTAFRIMHTNLSSTQQTASTRATMTHGRGHLGAEYLTSPPSLQIKSLHFAKILILASPSSWLGYLSSNVTVWSAACFTILLFRHHVRPLPSISMKMFLPRIFKIVPY